MRQNFNRMFSIMKFSFCCLKRIIEFSVNTTRQFQHAIAEPCKLRRELDTRVSDACQQNVQSAIGNQGFYSSTGKSLALGIPYFCRRYSWLPRRIE